MTFDLALPARSDRTFDVVGYGENSIDFLAIIGDWPAPDSKASLERLEIQTGGQMATAVLAAARLGCRARYVGAVGDDRWAAEIRSALAAGAIDVVAVERSGVSTRAAVVLVDAARRRTVLERRDPRLNLNQGDVDAAVFQSGRILMVDATDVAGSIRAATAARDAGTRVMLDVDRPTDGLESLLRLADVVITSEAFERGANPDVRPGQLWVRTLGAGGSVAWDGDREIRTRAQRVEIRDTTGAGDVFRGAFAARWASGDRELPALLEYANAAAALACRALGAQGSLPTPADVDSLRGETH